MDSYNLKRINLKQTLLNYLLFTIKTKPIPKH